MLASISTGDFNYYNNKNNNVKVPYRPGEGPKEQEIVIPFRSNDDAEPESNTYNYSISTHHGANAEVSFDNAEYGKVSIQPYTYNVDINNEDGQNIKVSVGPEISVSGLGSNLVDNADNPLDNIQEGGATCSNAGAKVRLEISKDLETVDNTAVYGEMEAGAGYTYIAPAGQKPGHLAPSELNPTGNGVRYHFNSAVGVEYKIDDKNKFAVGLNAGVDGYTATMQQGDPEDAGIVNQDGEQQYIETKVENNVIKAGATVSYTHKTKNGEIILEAKDDFGVRTHRSVSPSTTQPSFRNYNTGNYFGFGITYRF